MAGTITINEVLVGTNGISVSRNLPNNVLNLDILITSSDWLTLHDAGGNSLGSVDFEIDVFLGGQWATQLTSTGNLLGVVGRKGTLPHFFVGSDVLGPATQIRISATPTIPVHLGLVVNVG